MKKLKKLILTSGIFSSSLFFNPAYSQDKEYYTGNPNDPKSEIKKIDKETYDELFKNGWSRLANVWEDNYHTNKEYIVPKNNPQVTPVPSKTGNPNLLKTTQNEWEKAYDKNHNKNTYPSNKTYTPSKNVYIPPKKDEINWNKTLNNAVLIGGGLLILNELLKPRNKAPINNNPPPKNYNSPNTSYNYNPESNVDWWKEDKEKNKNSGGNWWSDEQKQEKPKDGNWWEDNKEKKIESQQRAEKTSKELSDFVEKQAGYSPETKIWFDEKAKEADEFYKEFYKNDPEAYAESQKRSKLEKVIGYEAYQIGKNYTPAGPVIEGVEKYDEIKEKGVENYWKEEVKKADEFLKEYESNPELKLVLDEKRLEEIINKDVYIQKIEKDKYSEQINKISYESDVSKVIRYRAYQYAKNHTPAGPVIKGVEKYEEKKESTGWWDK